ncbi:hypothetical protein [Miniphocaeibacter massiliensis]|uniref:hypothetical protein n=1 Tax=Miniphocaeibacter massiliensis TaxID=2041841 RepID=UPI000C06D75A|nr:hypothetical protein [Miniphocaeibacter massiliensis]
MKKKIILLFLILTLSLTACGKDDEENSTTELPKNKYIGGENIGEGNLSIVNKSKDNKIFTIKYDKDITNYGLKIKPGNIDPEKIITVYVDSYQITQEQFNNPEHTIVLTEPYLKKGTHNIEFIQRDGDKVEFYRLLKYKVK